MGGPNRFSLNLSKVVWFVLSIRLREELFSIMEQRFGFDSHREARVRSSLYAIFVVIRATSHMAVDSNALMISLDVHDYSIRAHELTQSRVTLARVYTLSKKKPWSVGNQQ